jgi:hypothetical protein
MIQPLLENINSSIKYGTSTSCSKNMVKLIPKRGPMDEVNNYRPITLVPIAVFWVMTSCSDVVG